MTPENLLYTLALLHIPQLGDTTARKLIQRCGSAQNIFKEKISTLEKVKGLGKTRLAEIQNAAHIKAAEKELEFIAKNRIQVHDFSSHTYPEKLKHCADAPVLLFSRGTTDLHRKKIISVVGTRQVTPQGAEFCRKLVEEIAIFDPVIVSGYAYGVDITAHRAAFQHRLQTVACLAHGFNQIYPKVHQKYCREMEENGGFFTDFWSTDKFDRNNFLKRNRIIAGLSEATLVIESAEKGGALVTADIAASYDREVFAVPGRPGDTFSTGCNNLIKSQQAHVLTSAADLAYILNWKTTTSEEIKPVQKQLFVQLDSEEQLLYNFLEHAGKSELDQIALNCHLPTFKTASMLLSLELKGIVRPLPGKLFEVI
ncbi:MAG: DNA-processing protein DprA [Christiangramia sp.]|uniref:DNA-processing protein DprA n=1 Tax=Christiangramia sp. TaxID=1931228 RepID=UPI003241EECE